MKPKKILLFFISSLLTSIIFVSCNFDNKSNNNTYQEKLPVQNQEEAIVQNFDKESYTIKAKSIDNFFSEEGSYILSNLDKEDADRLANKILDIKDEADKINGVKELKNKSVEDYNNIEELEAYHKEFGRKQKKADEYFLNLIRGKKINDIYNL